MLAASVKVCWNRHLAAATGVAAWYTGSWLGNAYSKKSNKPQSSNDQPKLGDPFGHRPKGPGDWALIATLGIAGGKLLNSCGKEE